VFQILERRAAVGESVWHPDVFLFEHTFDGCALRVFVLSGARS
jgi:hypothetical protein